MEEIYRPKFLAKTYKSSKVTKVKSFSLKRVSPLLFRATFGWKLKAKMRHSSRMFKRIVLADNVRSDRTNNYLSSLHFFGRIRKTLNLHRHPRSINKSFLRTGNTVVAK